MYAICDARPEPVTILLGHIRIHQHHILVTSYTHLNRIVKLRTSNTNTRVPPQSPTSILFCLRLDVPAKATPSIELLGHFHSSFQVILIAITPRLTAFMHTPQRLDEMRVRVVL